VSKKRDERAAGKTQHIGIDPPLNIPLSMT
jgi:hypothetical protein